MWIPYLEIQLFFVYFNVKCFLPCFMMFSRMVFVAVSITETFVPPPVIYANGAAPAIFISSKIMSAEPNVIEYNFCLLIIYSPFIK